MNLQVLDDMLRMLGHAPWSVASVAEALETLRLQAFDLIITDLHMPDAGGQELLQALMNSGKNFPAVVLVTADVMSRRPEDYLRMGFSDFLTKPVRLSDLQRVISAVSEKLDGSCRSLFG